MHHGVIDLHAKPEDLRRQAAYRREERIGGNDSVVLSSDERDPRVDQGLLRIEHVKGGALADAGLFAHPVERYLGRRHLRLRGVDLRLGRLDLAPGLDGLGLDLIARGVEVEPALSSVSLACRIAAYSPPP